MSDKLVQVVYAGSVGKHGCRCFKRTHNTTTLSKTSSEPGVRTLLTIQKQDTLGPWQGPHTWQPFTKTLWDIFYVPNLPNVAFIKGQAWLCSVLQVKLTTPGSLPYSRFYLACLGSGTGALSAETSSFSMTTFVRSFSRSHPQPKEMTHRWSSPAKTQVLYIVGREPLLVECGTWAHCYGEISQFYNFPTFLLNHLIVLADLVLSSSHVFLSIPARVIL